MKVLTSAAFAALDPAMWASSIRPVRQVAQVEPLAGGASRAVGSHPGRDNAAAPDGDAALAVTVGAVRVAAVVVVSGAASLHRERVARWHGERRRAVRPAAGAIQQSSKAHGAVRCLHVLARSPTGD